MTKEEYQDFALRYKGCGACFPMYHTLSRFEKMWFSAIQKDIAELEEKLANADYQLEGRDIKIKDLERENAELKADFIKSCKVKEQGFREAEQALERKDEQLTTAKEIIKNLLSEYTTYADSFDDRDNEIVEQAGQFLEENE